MICIMSEVELDLLPRAVNKTNYLGNSNWYWYYNNLSGTAGTNNIQYRN